jgi:hypothetical protein
MEYMTLDTGLGALGGVAVINYAQGQLGFLKKIAGMLPGANLGFIAVNAAGGIAVMHFIGEAPLEGRTFVIGAGVAVVYHVAVGMLPTTMQNMLNGTN